MNEGRIAGIIAPIKDGAERPEFEIVRRGHALWREEEACKHGKFILDEQWATVTCGKCKERIDPFSALMHYAANFHEIVRRHEQMVEAEKSCHIEELRRLGRLRDASDEERNEIARMTGWNFRGDVGELREAVRTIGRAIDERKWAKRSAR